MLHRQLGADGDPHRAANRVTAGWLKHHAKSIRWRLEIVSRPRDASGFVLLPKRWVVERTFAWLGRNRRLCQDDEHRTDSSACKICIGAIHLMLRRLQ